MQRSYVGQGSLINIFISVQWLDGLVGRTTNFFSLFGHFYMNIKVNSLVEYPAELNLLKPCSLIFFFESLTESYYVADL